MNALERIEALNKKYLKFKPLSEEMTPDDFVCKWQECQFILRDFEVMRDIAIQLEAEKDLAGHGPTDKCINSVYEIFEKHMAEGK